jgi:nucleotide-binding universal stress UspA family protein
MRHILVATDFSESAAGALAEAADLASKCQGRITLLHVIYAEKITEELLGLDAIEYLSRSLDAPPADAPYVPGQWVSKVREAAQQKLDEAAATVAGVKTKCDTAIAEGRPSVEILDYAQKHDVDLIVMGTHGRGAVGRALLGSVAENVIRQAECPVMVVRQRRAT